MNVKVISFQGFFKHLCNFVLSKYIHIIFYELYKNMQKNEGQEMEEEGDVVD